MNQPNLLLTDKYIDDMEEIWKDVKGYEGLYQISNLGKVKRLVSVKCKKERFLSITKDRKSGYCRVMLCKNNKTKRFLIHRLIAEHFIPNPENKPCIDHINGVKDDNRIENLRWCTYKENNNYQIAKRNNSESQKKLRLNTDWVKRNKEAIKKAMQTDEVRRKISLARKRNWANPEYVSNQTEKRKTKKVLQYDTNMEFIAEYNSINEAKRNTGVDASSIIRCCNSRATTAGGYIWKYKK